MTRFSLTATDGFRCSEGVPLTADHIAALVLWFCDWSVPAARFDVLSGHMTVTTVRDALQMAVFRSCQLQMPLNEFALLKALFAACD